MRDRFPVSVSTIRRVTVGLILAVLLVSSPTVGLVDLTPESRSPDFVGDGTATVANTTIPTDSVRMTHGRFGTDVVYLRFPPATVDVGSVTGRPRLVYVAAVPELDFRRSATTGLEPDTRGPTTVRMDARAFTYERVGGNTYRVLLSVRVQSFETDDVVYRRNVTVTAPTKR